MTIDPTGALPVVPDTALPADVRNGSAADKQTYSAALAFERELLSQMMQALTDTTQASSDDSSDDGSTDTGTDAATSTYQQMLPDQMASAVVNGGGTGLAENLYRALRQGESA
ncbi:MAG: rod-binding protein [Thermoleophilaceae bacterium]